jgi:hypothetical protein
MEKLPQLAKARAYQLAQAMLKHWPATLLALSIIVALFARLQIEKINNGKSAADLATLRAELGIVGALQKQLDEVRIKERKLLLYHIDSLEKAKVKVIEKIKPVVHEVIREIPDSSARKVNEIVEGYELALSISQQTVDSVKELYASVLEENEDLKAHNEAIKKLNKGLQKDVDKLSRSQKTLGSTATVLAVGIAIGATIVGVAR